MKDTHAQPAGSLPQPSVYKNSTHQSGELNGITRVFVNRDRLAFLWFWVAAGAVAFACGRVSRKEYGEHCNAVIRRKHPPKVPALA